jgi:hypothetical protein
MPNLSHRFVCRASMVALTAGVLLAPPLAAQSTVTVHTDARDSVSWIVPRAQLGDAESVLRTSDRSAALLLMDSTIVLQFTNRGLSEVKRGGDDTTGGLAAQLLARMVMSGVVTLLDHGIAYRLDALGEARSEGSRLVLVDRKGKRVFEGVDINGRQVLESFVPSEAERFAAELNQAIQRRR